MAARCTGIILALASLLAFVFPAAAGAAMPCTSSSMYVVAHQDDTLIFQNPAFLQEVHAGNCVRTVFLTAGDDGKSQSYWTTREQGAEAAYAQLAGASNEWSTSNTLSAGHSIPTATLSAQPNVSIVFMRLPDGGYPAGLGNPLYKNQSLMQLWNGGNGATPAESTITSVDGANTYTYKELIATLTGLMTSFGPQVIATQNYLGHFNGADHNDHVAAAYLARTAQRSYAAAHELVGYEGYEDESRPANVSGSALAAKSSAFYVYSGYDVNGCATASACAGSPYGAWLARQYVAAHETVAGTTSEPTNVAPLATATASSQTTAYGQTAAKAIDGVISGYPNNIEAEWASEGGGSGTTLTLNWARSYSVEKVVLFDRPNTDDQITSGTLTFSDGSQVSFGSLSNSGSTGLTVSFPARATTSLKMTVTGVSSTTQNAGLSEIQVFGTPVGSEPPPAENEAPTAVAGPAQSTTAGATVSLDGSASTDPQGGPLTYKWQQTAGPAVSLSSSTAAKPTFTAPSGPATLSFSLTVSDGTLTSAPSTVIVTVAGPPQPTNVAPLATATASSQTTAYGQTAAKAIDGVISGYPNNIEAEWASEGGGSGTTLTLNWARSYSVEKVVLFDRPNTDDQITSGTLTFSDGSQVSFGSLSNSGSTGLTVSFPARATTSLKMTVTGVSSTTQNAGLSEIQVFGTPVGSEPPPAENEAPTAVAGPAQSTTAGATVSLDGSASTDPQGGPLTYKWQQTAGPAVSLSSSTAAKPTFTAPSGPATLSFSLTVSDGTLTSAPSTVIVTVAGPPQPTNVAPLATATASSQTTAYGQTAAKAIDGVISGYPNNIEAEWASEGGGSGTTLTLNWARSYSVEKVVLFDRPNTDDQITSGTLTFSDGSQVSFGSLSNSGSTGLTVSFPARATTSLKMTVTGVSSTTQNAGLSEIQVFGTPAGG